ncbi:MAG: D-aminoacyl-tRNA deacylase [bacterium]
MKAVVQRVKEANCRVNGNSIGAIQQGLVVFLGVAEGDNEEDLAALADKIADLRVFGDDQGNMQHDLSAVDGSILVIPNFTLYADLNQGRRPSFHQAAAPDAAEELYEKFIERLKQHNLPVEAGRFGAMMDIDVHNDGPVSLVLESSDFT